MLSMTLTDYLEEVKDFDTFLDFVWALIKDREEAIQKELQSPSSPYGPDAGGWENIRIETYLEAATAWAQSSNMGQSMGLPEESSWKGFATFLYMGKIYE